MCLQQSSPPHAWTVGWLGLLVSAALDTQSLIWSGALCELSKAKVSTAIPMEAEEVKAQGSARV